MRAAQTEARKGLLAGRALLLLRCLGLNLGRSLGLGLGLGLCRIGLCRIGLRLGRLRCDAFRFLGENQYDIRQCD